MNSKDFFLFNQCARLSDLMGETSSRPQGVVMLWRLAASSNFASSTQVCNLPPLKKPVFSDYCLKNNRFNGIVVSKITGSMRSLNLIDRINWFSPINGLFPIGMLFVVN